MNLIYLSNLELQNGSFGATVKLLSCDLGVTGSNRKNNHLQCKVKLYTISSMWSDAFPRPYIGGSFVLRAAIFFIQSKIANLKLPWNI